MIGSPEVYPPLVLQLLKVAVQLAVGKGVPSNRNLSKYCGPSTPKSSQRAKKEVFVVRQEVDRNVACHFFGRWGIWIVKQKCFQLDYLNKNMNRKNDIVFFLGGLKKKWGNPKPRNCKYELLKEGKNVKQG